MKKELLTREKILNEERVQLEEMTKVGIIGLIIHVLLLALMLWISIVVIRFVWIALFLGALPFCMIYVFISGLLKEYMLYCDLKNGRFSVVADTLIECRDRQSDVLKRGKVPYVLRFITHGEYTVPLGEHYKTFQEFKMSDDGIFNTAVKGDTFYLLLDKKEKILQVYNTKFFEWEEDAEK